MTNQNKQKQRLSPFETQHWTIRNKSVVEKCSVPYPEGNLIANLDAK